MDVVEFCVSLYVVLFDEPYRISSIERVSKTAIVSCLAFSLLNIHKNIIKMTR